MNRKLDIAESIVLLAGGVSFILGLISRYTMQPFPFAPGGMTARSFLAITNTCLLTAIILILLGIVKEKNKG